MYLQSTALMDIEMTETEPIPCPWPPIFDNYHKCEITNVIMTNVRELQAEHDAQSTPGAALALQELKRCIEESYDDAKVQFPMNQNSTAVGPFPYKQ